MFVNHNDFDRTARLWIIRTVINPTKLPTLLSNVGHTEDVYRLYNGHRPLDHVYTKCFHAHPEL